MEAKIKSGNKMEWRKQKQNAINADKNKAKLDISLHFKKRTNVMPYQMMSNQSHKENSH